MMTEHELTSSGRRKAFTSVGKDSAVMLHHGIERRYPGKLRFGLLHVDTTWKFKEMIEFRDSPG